ncbi:MAG: hypothetical protein Q4D58_09795 [Synergistaceae bacterium]|nr:hypothetical protein [Synergistaceae bacterium]
MKYTKRPVEIEAVRFEDSVECFDKLQALGLDPARIGRDVEPPVLRIDTLEGEMTAQLGDYIIKGVRGEFYPCKPDIFEETYIPTGKCDWKVRLELEYKELSERVEKLEAMLEKYRAGILGFKPNCSYDLLYEQLVYMKNYLAVLEKRARIEGL